MKGKVGLFSLFWFLTFYIDFNGSMRHVSLAGSSFRYPAFSLSQMLLDKWIYETFFSSKMLSSFLAMDGTLKIGLQLLPLLLFLSAKPFQHHREIWMKILFSEIKGWGASAYFISFYHTFIRQWIGVHLLSLFLFPTPSSYDFNLFIIFWSSHDMMIIALSYDDRHVLFPFFSSSTCKTFPAPFQKLSWSNCKKLFN